MATLFRRRRAKATQTERVRERRHEGFLRHANFRWAKISGGLCLLVIVSYTLIDVTPRPNGGSWYGYTLGTIGALLILWLTAPSGGGSGDSTAWRIAPAVGPDRATLVLGGSF